MLSERHTRLVTDYVDGTLNSRQRKTVLKLLHKSAKARRLLEELQANVQLLRSLPKHTLEPQFATKLVNEIKTRGLERVSGPMPVLRPAAARPAVPRRSFPSWVGVAVAAAVLAMVTFGSYVFFAKLGDDSGDNNTPIVETPPKPPEKIPPEPTKPHPLVNNLIAGSYQGYNRPIGVQFAGRDLAKPKTQKLLAKELYRRTSFHVDVACRENGPAVRQLITALETNKVKVFVDDRAKPELACHNPKVEYLVYAENLHADDVSKILRQLGANKSDQVQGVLLSDLTDGHRTTLSRIFGVDAKSLQAPPGKPMELHNPIEVPKEGKDDGKKNGAGSTPKSNNLTSAEPMALVMVLEPGVSRSAQIQQFLARRKAARPGSLQVVMVVHS